MSTDKLTLSKRDARRLARVQAKAAPRRKREPGLLKRLLEESKQTALVPAATGWKRPGGGPAGYIEPLEEVQGTAVQVCGLWPWVNGSSLPMVGVPLGDHLLRNSLVCGDPVGWFLAGIISNPSAFVLAQPGLGKTTLVHQMIAFNTAWGVIPMVLSDSRPDYVHHIRALGGQVITFSPGRGHLNPLDLGPLVASLGNISDETQREVALEEMRGRRRSLMSGLVSMLLGDRLQPHEASVLAQAVHLMDPNLDEPPVLGELVEFIQSRPERLRQLTMAYDDDPLYDERVRRILDALISLGPAGAYGDMFSKPSDAHIKPGTPVVFDISGVNENDAVLTAAVQSLCWNLGSATVSAESYLAADGQRPRRTYLLVMDELWRIVRASGEMVHFIDTITRLNRGRGIAQIMITHTMKDLQLSEDHLTSTAWGFVERSAMVYLGGLAPNEMGNLEEVFSLTGEEKRHLTDWTAKAPIDPTTGRSQGRPGAGHFILKVGKSPGVPFRTRITESLFEISNTNSGWAMESSNA